MKRKLNPAAGPKLNTEPIALCRLDELIPGGAHRFEVEGKAVAVVRIGDDVYAVGDRCTHQGVSLSEGEVDEKDRLLECWKHGSQFSLVTGQPLQLPALKPTPGLRSRDPRGGSAAHVVVSQRTHERRRS